MNKSTLRALADSMRNQDRLVHADELVRAIDALCAEEVAEPKQPGSDAGRTIQDIADEGAKKAAEAEAKAEADKKAKAEAKAKAKADAEAAKKPK
ncbi:hypothetical protein [Tolypothrix sp. VBCCA 56010]|uniref:hypothetical protein n=1 Tax=Tolypothrix sp. VBCCA 56010 TaxID=3137731 RepID=UPI003D7D28C2